jgi:transcriptional regulator with XRE-family HTH domain
MNYEKYLRKRRQDPEYREVEKRMKPILDLADDVFALRMERGWTQEELARKAGTKQANISRLENGLANPTLKFLQKVSEALETDLVVRLQPPTTNVHTHPISTDREYTPLPSKLTYSVRIGTTHAVHEGIASKIVAYKTVRQDSR